MAFDLDFSIFSFYTAALNVHKGGIVYRKRIVGLFACAILFGVFAGCSSSDGGDSGTGLVMGYVKDTAATPVAISGVTVTAVGTSAAAATTDAEGYFVIEGLSENNHQVVSFSKTGYSSTTQISNIISGLGDFLNVTMAEEDATGTSTFNGSAGKTLTDSVSGQVAIGASTLETSSGETVTGSITANITSQDPTTTGGLNAFPGEYVGVTSLTDPTTNSPLISNGYATIAAQDASGNSLNLKSGQTATLTLPIPTSMQASAAATIDLWHFDTTTGQWLKSGTATKSGNNYVATLTSFSTWNFDVSYQAAYVSGTVTDCATGNPIQGARVTLTGTGWKSGETGTDSDGHYPNARSSYYAWLGVPVEPNSTFSITVQKNGATRTTTGTAPNAGMTSTINICLYTIAGTYSGTYTGSIDCGTWTATIAETGLITGSGVSENEGGFDITGHVGPSGAITMGAASIENATFTGSINGETGVASGTWSSASDGGSFSGNKQ